MAEYGFSGHVPESDVTEQQRLRSRLGKVPLDAFVASDLPSLLRIIGVSILGDPSERDLEIIKGRVEAHDRKKRKAQKRPLGTPWPNAK